MRLDDDVWKMGLGERGWEIMRLRVALRRWRRAQGNARCWLEDERLLAVLPEQKSRGLIRLSRATFLKNCERYAKRQSLK